MPDPTHATFTAADLHVVFACDGTTLSLHAFGADVLDRRDVPDHRLGVSRVTFHCTDEADLANLRRQLATLGLPAEPPRKDDIVVEFVAPAQ